MDATLITTSLFLGFIEGMTEFLPVSSTAHLILMRHFFSFSAFEISNTFLILVQLGAIFAILSIYSQKICSIIKEFFYESSIRHFVFGVIIAFIPAAILGVVIHDFIKTLLFDCLYFICFSLIIGGIILLLIDKTNLKKQYDDMMLYPWSLCLKIGLCQCFAMIPGISRSGVTIVCAILMGANKKSAAEFSFFIAIPTMFGAFSYDLFTNYEILSLNDWFSIILGFMAAFITGLVVVRCFLNYVTRYGLAIFGWWRIIIGILGLIFLLVF